MSQPWRKFLTVEWIGLTVLLVLPWLLVPESALGMQLPLIFIFGLLALGLNVVVGYTGLLHLGIAAFFGIGAYVTGILTVESYPFRAGFFVSLVAATAAAGIAGLLLGAPTLRLRGDYLAVVTLGFGEVVRYGIRNLEEITAGTKGLNPIPPPKFLEPLGLSELAWTSNFRPFYFLTLACLVLVVVMLLNLERSRLGRAWMAIREDELAATCMGIDATRAKLAAFAVGAGLAGLAGCLYATQQTTTADPEAYNFNRSIILLCCLILGGLGSVRGTLLGALILFGFDNVLAPWLDEQIQRAFPDASGSEFLRFANWKLMIFGLALILMMRFRPEGLLPARRNAE